MYDNQAQLSGVGFQLGFGPAQVLSRIGVMEHSLASRVRKILL